jgi:hypothetical protein
VGPDRDSAELGIEDFVATKKSSPYAFNLHCQMCSRLPICSGVLVQVMLRGPILQTSTKSDVEGKKIQTCDMSNLSNI